MRPTRLFVIGSIVVLGACSQYEIPTTPSVAPPVLPDTFQLLVTTRPDQTLDISAVWHDGTTKGIAGRAVAFTTTHGTISPTTATTDELGVAHTIAVPDGPATIGATSADVARTMTVIGPVLQAFTLGLSQPGRVTTTEDASFIVTSASPIAQADWEFGDGSSAHTNGTIVAHRFRSSGRYQLRVTATDAAGRTASAAQTIAVDARSIGAFVACARYGLWADCRLGLSDGSDDDLFALLSSVTWEWGDGTVSSQANDGHSYPSEGDYHLTVTCRFRDGGVAIATTVNPMRGV